MLAMGTNAAMNRRTSKVRASAGMPLPRPSIWIALALLLGLTACAAIGRPEWVGADMVKKGAVVVDVGVHRVEDSSKERGYRICGDVNQAEVAGRVSAMTPVPGGVGPMTVAMLVSNTLKAASLQTQPRE